MESFYRFLSGIIKKVSTLYKAEMTLSNMIVSFLILLFIKINRRPDSGPYTLLARLHA